MNALSFANPLMLAALAVLPVIWLLLRATPPSPSKVKFPAFILLRRLARTQETPDKTPWWLMLLRLMIAALVIAGLAGPALNAPPPSTATGPVIIVVDNSWAAAANWNKRRTAISNIADDIARTDRNAYLIATAGGGDQPMPMSGEELKRAAEKLAPQPILPDLEAARTGMANLADTVSQAQVKWLSDGLRHDGAADFRKFLSGLGPLDIYADDRSGGPVVFPSQADGFYRVEMIGGGDWSGDLVAFSRDGRELARSEVQLSAEQQSALVNVDLPLALQNRLSQVRLEGVASAGAVQLLDARNHRALVGFMDASKTGGDPLLSGAYYVRRALEPFAEFTNGSITELTASDASVIVLDDIGVLRTEDADLLRAWMEKGGVVIRFAGANVAEAAQQSSPPLLPVRLRGGGRAFGGALTWETPQLLGGFADSGPFAELATPSDVFVRRQVLAEPGGETTTKTWASLADGTPLVTGERLGDGALVLFHVTATPEWSDLPLSGVFIDMLHKAATLSALGPEAVDDATQLRLPAIKLLDGYGVLQAPPDNAPGLSLQEAALGPAATRLPGLYGAPEALIALNAVNSADTFEPLSAADAPLLAYAGRQALHLAAPLFLLALLAFFADTIAALLLSGRVRFAAAVLAVICVAPNAPVRAQPLDTPIDEISVDAALSTHLAYVRTGDPAIDRISQTGLAALSRELTRRTAVEPAAPIGVDPETDDLSVFQFLYWPLTPGAAAPSPGALANIENYMRFGGLVVFDTRDDERAVPGVVTPERQALQAILQNVDMPPLAPTPTDHVLMRSFYLLNDLTGRMSLNPVWVQAGDGPNDSVTPVIIGGRDWAGAWASDELGRPILPMAQGGERAREYAIRVGVNMVMVALTGNYKSDQVHTPILLERLGHE